MIKKVLVLVDRLYWLWLLFVVPFLLFPSPKRSLVMLVLPATWILHLVLVRTDSRSTNHEEGLPTQEKRYGFTVTPMNLALLLLAVMVLVSIWTTYDISYSLGKIEGVILGFGVYFAVVRLCEDQRGLWISLALFTALGLLIAALGLLGTDWTPITKITSFTEITSHIPGLINGLQGAESGFNANEVAGTLVWIFPATLSFSAINLLSFRIIKNLFAKIGNLFAGLCLLAINLFIAAVILLTQSRGAYIGIAFAILMMIFFGIPKNWKCVFLVGLAILIIVSGMFLSAALEKTRGGLSNIGLAEDSAFSLDSLQMRFVIWSSAIKGIQDFPFTGMGMNTFRTLIGVLYPNSENNSYLGLGHAHNEFLQAGLDLGIPGMIAFISLYISAFWMLVKTWKTSFLLKNDQKINNQDNERRSKLGILTKGPAIRTIVLGLGGGLLAHLLYGFTDAVALGAKPGFVFWMLLAMIAGLFSLIYKSDALNNQMNEISSK